MDDLSFTHLISEFLDNLKKDSPYEEICFTSRVRLMRNVFDYNFIGNLLPEEKEELANKIKEKLLTILDDSIFFHNSNFSYSQKELLSDIMIISRDEITKNEDYYMGFSSKTGIGIFINRKDHIRIWGMKNGLIIDDLFYTIKEIEEQLSSKFHFAFHDKLGYLSRFIEGCGTGVRFSVVLHIPSISLLRDKLEQLKRRVSIAGLSLTPFPYMGVDGSSNLFLLRNEFFLGHSDEEMLDRMYAIIKDIIDMEYENRYLIWKKMRSYIEDKIWRSYAILKYGRVLGYDEFLQRWSFLRLGIGMGIINDIDIIKMNNIFFMAMNNYLRLFYQEDIPLDNLRSAIVRTNLWE